jgi:hypothetical protein
VVYEGTQQVKDGQKVVPRKAEIAEETPDASSVAKVR